MHRLAEGIVRLAKEIGVTFHTGHKVEKLIVEQEQIRAARLDHGTFFIEADYFVSNMEVIPAYEELLEEAPTFTQKLEEKFEPASSGFVLH